MRVITESASEHRENIRRLAAQELAGHRVEFIGQAGDTRVYDFSSPGSMIYAVRILVWPGWIVVAGDVGDTLFMHSDRDSLAWLRKSIADVRYMLGKVQGARRVFCVGNAMAFAEELAGENPEAARVLREEWNPIDDGPDDFYRACAEAEIDDTPDCTDWEDDHVLAVEILRAFVVAIDAQEQGQA